MQVVFFQKKHRSGQNPKKTAASGPPASPIDLRQPNAFILESSILDYFAFTDRAVAFKADPVPGGFSLPVFDGDAQRRQKTVGKMGVKWDDLLMIIPPGHKNVE